jgi:hypothetical protein
MRIVSSKRRSSFGANCVRCDNELIAPERSEYRNWGADTSFLALLEMRLLFRSRSACAHQVDRRYYEKDRRHHETTRRSSVAISRIGGNAADIRRSLDIYMNLWESRDFRIEGNIKFLHFG